MRGKAAFFGLAAVKLWLAGGPVITAIGPAMHDDLLFVKLGKSLSSFSWLGPYDHLTLIKGPFYPLWIAVTFLLGIPLPTAQHLLYIAACAVFIIAVRPVVSGQGTLFLLWAVLLFNPMSCAIMATVEREGIYPALTVLVAAGAVGILARYERPPKDLAPWSKCLGFSFAAFWLTREEGIWMIPTVLLIVGFAAVGVRRIRPENIRRYLFHMCVAPFCIWLAAVGVVAGINKIAYGLFTTVEFRSSDFLAAYGALTRVKHSRWDPYYPVPRETRRRIYKISPAFAELSPSLEGFIGAAWISSSCAASPCDDIGGGGFMWALRDAVKVAGYHTSAGAAADYYRRLSEEVNLACADRRIECGPERASMMPPWRGEYARPLLDAFIACAGYLSRFEGFDARPSPSVGREEELVLFRDMTRTNTFSHASIADVKKLRQISGWAFAVKPGSSPAFSMRDADGAPVSAKVKISASEDIYRRFLSEGKDFPNARNARFIVTAFCTDAYRLNLKTDDGSGEQNIPLDGSVTRMATPDIYFQIDSVEYDFLPNQSKLDHIKISILSRIGAAYQAAAPFFAAFALICYLIISVNMLRTRTVKNLWLINTALLIALVIRLLIISIIHVTSFSAINTRYLSPAYPLLLIFAILALPVRRNR
jgi:hypothetical protein